ncbi:MAG: ATP-binding cassette domain-containing protein [Puniceicoccales bacterium]|jgi:iron complex transport system ATP-binding protein|nr:ATP-binding cassette domain-containing protein [Puniceicoccales bacterium]
MTPLIDVKNLCVERDRVILHRIDWQMRTGENWVILGANGSGKTSLLAVLTGYLAETRGTVSIAGATRGADDWRELRKRVGLVSNVLIRMIEPEEPALSVVAGGREAKLNLWGAPDEAGRRMALALMRRTGCTRLAAQPWRTLSQGERQRVLIARALFSGMSVLILDEPCAGLDPVAREHFLEMLGRLGTGARAVPLVLVTHHVEEIIPLFTHVLMLRKGRVLASGPIRDTLTSQNLSALFGAAIRLRRVQGRYMLVPLRPTVKD